MTNTDSKTGALKSTMISLGRFQDKTAEALKAKLTAMSKDCYWRPQFLACPAGGESELWAQSEYDFSTDHDDQPVDPEKNFAETMLWLLVSALSDN